ncbi:unnamed protein product [Somion occarium]|uniref:RNA polymerase II elongation factor ELL N-terminal domain-containing protein n=1 Tax=Somion occarium TaxID=3059160 RepID=A0ABP1DHY2_9APHY
MPLPGNGTLSLHGYSRIGDTATTEPKKGMIIRMSPETLDALQDNLQKPNIELQLEDNPGLWIAGKFFSMNSQPENSPHELYLRTSTASKPNAPLKLQANIIGKFVVNRELDQRLQNKLRGSAAAAEKQREERQIQILDEPPIMSKPGAKKAKEAAGTKKTRKTGTTVTTVKSTTTRDRSFSPSLPAEEKNYKVIGDPSTRRRLVHCLAIQPRDTIEVVNMVGGKDCDAATKNELFQILKTCAVRRAEPQSPDSKPKWYLLANAWREVRPFEYDLADAERTRMARECRRNFALLKIPESDPLWEHARFRDPGNSRPGASTAPEPKKGITTREAKQKKAAIGASKKGNDTIIAKDERVQSTRSKAEPPVNAGSGTTVRAVPRKPPGSGYKSKAGSTTPSPSTPEISSVGPSSLPRKPDFLPTQSRTPSGTDRTSAKPRDALPSSNTNEGRANDVASLSFKRKTAMREEQEAEMSDRDRPKPMLKRRKIGETNETQNSRPTYDRIPSLPNKPTTAIGDASPRPASRAIKKEASPFGGSPLPRSPLPPTHSSLPPTRSPLATRKSRQGQSSQPSTRNGSSKPKRRSPIYTSSEDEQDPPPKPAARNSEAASHSANPPPPAKKAGRTSREKEPLSLPDDEAGLRKLYKSKYRPYITLYTKHVSAVDTIERLLAKDDETTDSDIDMDVLDENEMMNLKTDLTTATEELEMIRDAHSKLMRLGKASGKLSDDE